ncbi:MAG: DUF493 domain-containing protein [Pseudomonadota bacterium]
MSAKDPKDGFDLIEYPCDYSFKAMCKADDSDSDANSVMIRDLVLQFLPAEDVLETQSRLSRTGKFESVTISVRLSNRQQLEAIYQAISAAPKVVMTL